MRPAGDQQRDGIDLVALGEDVSAGRDAGVVGSLLEFAGQLGIGAAQQRQGPGDAVVLPFVEHAFSLKRGRG